MLEQSNDPRELRNLERNYFARLLLTVLHDPRHEVLRAVTGVDLVLEPAVLHDACLPWPL